MVPSDTWAINMAAITLFIPGLLLLSAKSAMEAYEEFHMAETGDCTYAHYDKPCWAAQASGIMASTDSLFLTSTWRCGTSPHHITSHLFHISKMVKIWKIPKSIRNCRPSLRKHFGASGGAEIWLWGKSLENWENGTFRKSNRNLRRVVCHMFSVFLRDISRC